MKNVSVKQGHSKIMRLALRLILAHFLILTPILADDKTENSDKLKALRNKRQLAEFWSRTKDSFTYFVPLRIKNLFYTNQKPDNPDKNEHGKLDFFGRDILRTVGEKIAGIGQRIGWDSNSTSSGGLDTDKRFFSGVRDSFKEKIRAIVPGTNWCGDGDRAVSPDDLGRFFEEDNCCRSHDNCPFSILAGETKYGLRNTGLFTRSRCDCDRDFYNCLQNVGSIIAKQIGYTYFNVLGPQCFVVDNCKDNISGCSDRTGRTNNPQYKWNDNPKF